MTSDQFIDKIRIYKDTSGEWRWTAYAGNNKVVADSAEGYGNHSDALAAASGIVAGGTAVVVDIDHADPTAS
jgi:uncharacterized protein YegP (UPF0339 family)